MNQHQLSDIFKTEYSNLVAVLCHYYNLSDVQLAEDIVSETFIKAMKAWSHKGVPDNPKAWLRKAAQNQLMDHFRRKKIFNEKVIPNLELSNGQTFAKAEITNEIIKDSQLKMIFVVCNPKLSNKAQICLALRILCGFNISEISKALLSNNETINKTLYRAKKAIKEEKQLNMELSKEDYHARIDNVLRIIYLLFNEGYYSSIQEENIREEICWEAMRLTLFLSKQQQFETDMIYALLAIMCFHVSRFEARKLGANGDLLFDQQDRSKWNQDLIRQGAIYLQHSSNKNKISKYHLEARIAFWHTTDKKEKWNHILQLYNRLLMIEYSPIIALNRTYALAKATSVDQAIQEALKFDLNQNHHYLCLLAELYRMNNDYKNEKAYLTKALNFTNKEAENALILSKIKTANQNNSST